MSFTLHDCKCVAETDAAILVESPDLTKSEWIPKSQLDDDSEIFRKGHTGTCVVTEWLAEQRGWL